MVSVQGPSQTLQAISCTPTRPTPRCSQSSAKTTSTAASSPTLHVSHIFLQGCLSCKWQCLTKLDRRASANASCAVVFSESLALANSFGIVNPFGTSLTFSVVKVWRIHLLFSDVGPCKAGIVWLRADTLPLDTDACLAHVGR